MISFHMKLGKYLKTVFNQISEFVQDYSFFVRWVAGIIKISYSYGLKRKNWFLDETERFEINLKNMQGNNPWSFGKNKFLESVKVINICWGKTERNCIISFYVNFSSTLIEAWIFDHSIKLYSEWINNQWTMGQKFPGLVYQGPTFYRQNR